MKSTLFATVLGLSTLLASAAPVNEAAQKPTYVAPPPGGSSTATWGGSSIAPTGGSSTAPFATGGSSSAPFATGTGTIISVPVPTGTGTGTGTGVPRPSSTGSSSSSCSPNGALICNGPFLQGLCNWGQVIFQPVAAGTMCKDGKIMFAKGFPGSPDWQPHQSGPAPPATMTTSASWGH